MEKVAIAVVSIAALIAPYGTFGYSIMSHGSDIYANAPVFAILWCIMPLEGGLALLVFDPLWTLLCAIFGIFNILFDVQFNRHYRLLASSTTTILTGLLTLVLPTVFAVLFVSGYSSFPGPVDSPYIGPVPIQLAIALLSCIS